VAVRPEPLERASIAVPALEHDGARIYNIVDDEPAPMEQPAPLEEKGEAIIDEAKGEAMTRKEKATWRDPALGVARELELPQGRLCCF
jgi:hypothetical protein